ncbi:hypothetical protein ACEN19_11085 [Corynebacterium auriscanis]|uniref:hypothetical protein n=1 Tax=Corynebacterium auriscanis TaxID=99807 RepID=UPI003CF18259
MHYSGLVRSLNRNGLSTEQVVQIAVAYKIPIVQALIDTGRIESNDVEPESPERIAETISYLARKLAVQVRQSYEEEKSNIHPLPKKNVQDDPYTYLQDQAVAYQHEEIGGNLDDLDP